MSLATVVKREAVGAFYNTFGADDAGRHEPSNALTHTFGSCDATSGVAMSVACGGSPLAMGQAAIVATCAGSSRGDPLRRSSYDPFSAASARRPPANLGAGATIKAEAQIVKTCGDKRNTSARPRPRRGEEGGCALVRGRGLGKDWADAGREAP